MACCILETLLLFISKTIDVFKITVLLIYFPCTVYTSYNSDALQLIGHLSVGLTLTAVAVKELISKGEASTQTAAAGLTMSFLAVV